MAKKGNSERSVIGDAVRTAVGGLIFCGILYLLDIQFGLLKILSIDIVDLQMISVCVVLFALFWPTVAKIFFEPYLKLVTERERLTVGAETYLKEQEAHADELVEKYESRLSEVRGSAMREKMSAVAEAKEQALKIVDKAQNEAQQILREARSNIAARNQQLEQRLSTEADDIARSVVSRVMGAGGAASLGALLLLAAAALVSFVFVLPGYASAASAAHGEGPGSIGDLKFFFVNFILYLVIIALLVRKFAPRAWGARRQRILQQLTASQQKIVDAEKRVVEARGRLAKVEEDASIISKTIQTETSREVSHIKATAEQSAERIIEQARASAAAEEKSAEKVIKRRLVERALELAERNIKASITPDSDSALRQRAQSKLSELRQ
ncbi:MAG: hypothetical protein J5J00_10490 [Deltaproteobacteria bacterium]|nr:hypothetical protein [Deltaproteobacteria bacterium]